MSRQKNPHKMVNWAIVSAASSYNRGVGDIISRREMYMGVSSTTHILGHVKPYCDNMIPNVTQTLSHVDKTVWILNNNQRGHPLKFQRYGSSPYLSKSPVGLPKSVYYLMWIHMGRKYEAYGFDLCQSENS